MPTGATSHVCVRSQRQPAAMKSLEKNSETHLSVDFAPEWIREGAVASTESEAPPIPYGHLR